jgi:hypothetical protein
MSLKAAKFLIEPTHLPPRAQYWACERTVSARLLGQASSVMMLRWWHHPALECSRTIAECCIILATKEAHAKKCIILINKETQRNPWHCSHKIYPCIYSVCAAFRSSCWNLRNSLQCGMMVLPIYLCTKISIPRHSQWIWHITNACLYFS